MFVDPAAYHRSGLIWAEQVGNGADRIVLAPVDVQHVIWVRCTVGVDLLNGSVTPNPTVTRLSLVTAVIHMALLIIRRGSRDGKEKKESWGHTL